MKLYSILNCKFIFRYLLHFIYLSLLLFPFKGSFAISSCRQPLNAREEKDDVFMLLAYSVVLKGWQNDDIKHNRGFNIGSVLVAPDSKVVYWGRNSVNLTKNMTEHGEVRLINHYLHWKKIGNLKNYTIYTTLEPCAMCSGMMILANISRVVFGENDRDFGKALDRLKLDSQKLPNGFIPYPRSIAWEPSLSSIRCSLDEAYLKFMKKNNLKFGHTTQFLTTDEAKKIYNHAFNSLINYKVKFPENQPIIDQAREFYHGVVTIEEEPNSFCNSDSD